MRARQLWHTSKTDTLQFSGTRTPWATRNGIEPFEGFANRRMEAKRLRRLITQRSEGSRPLCLAIRAIIFGPDFVCIMKCPNHVGPAFTSKYAMRPAARSFDVPADAKKRCENTFWLCAIPSDSSGHHEAFSNGGDHLFAVLNAVSKNSQGKCLNLYDCGFSGGAIHHNAVRRSVTSTQSSRPSSSFCNLDFESHGHGAPRKVRLWIGISLSIPACLASYAAFRYIKRLASGRRCALTACNRSRANPWSYGHYGSGRGFDLRTEGVPHAPTINQLIKETPHPAEAASTR